MRQDNEIREQAAKKIQHFWRVKKFLRNPNLHAIENLTAINKALDERNISINLAANPPIVARKEIDMPTAEITLNRFREKKYADVLRHFLQRYVTHISFEHFMQALKESCAKFNTWMLDHPDLQNYTVLYQTRKSQQWVASLALRYLAILPRFDFNYTLNDTSTLEPLPNLIDFRQNKTFVMFDDNSLSGQQIYQQVIKRFFTVFKRYKNANDEATDIHLIIIVPFATSRALQKIAREIGKDQDNLNNSKLQIQVKLICTRILPVISQLPLSNEHKQLLLASFGYGSEKMENLPVCFSDWKLPDAMSIPRIFRGSICVTHDKYTGCQLSSVPDQKSMLPDTQPPYKKNRPMFFKDHDGTRKVNDEDSALYVVPGQKGIL